MRINASSILALLALGFAAAASEVRVPAMNGQMEAAAVRHLIAKGRTEFDYQAPSGGIFPVIFKTCLGDKLYAFFERPVSYEICKALSGFTGLPMANVDNLSLPALTTCFKPSFWDGLVNTVDFQIPLWSEYPGVAVPALPDQRFSCLLEFAPFPPYPPHPPVCEPGKVIVSSQRAVIGEGNLCLEFCEERVHHVFNGTISRNFTSGMVAEFSDKQGIVTTCQPLPFSKLPLPSVLAVNTYTGKQGLYLGVAQRVVTPLPGTNFVHVDFSGELTVSQNATGPLFAADGTTAGAMIVNYVPNWSNGTESVVARVEFTTDIPLTETVELRFTTESVNAIVTVSPAGADLAMSIVLDGILYYAVETGVQPVSILKTQRNRYISAVYAPVNYG